MASCSPIFLVLFFYCYSRCESSFIKVECDKKIVGQFNHQSMLMCTVGTTQPIPALKITLVVWRKNGEPFLVFEKTDDEKVTQKSEPAYKMADPSLKNWNVSLLIANTELKDEGEYRCEVLTDSGYNFNTVSLEVTAKYSAPIIELIERKELPNAQKSLVCTTRGGYPEGQLHWIDENKTNWTKSAKLTENKTEDGLIDLQSELPLLSGSTFPEYTCVVYNPRNGKVDSTTTALREKLTDYEYIADPHETPKPMTSNSKVIAPVLVIGALIVGLLMAVLAFRRRSQQIRRPSTTPLMGTHHEVPPLDMEVDFPQDDNGIETIPQA